MKTLFLVFALTLFIGNASGSIKASYFDFKPELTNQNESFILENDYSLPPDCVDVWQNCSTQKIHYSADYVGPGGLGLNAGFVNVSIYTGPSLQCQNDVLLYHGEHLGTTGSIPFSALSSAPLLCTKDGLDYITVYVKYQWGGPSEYCSVTEIFEVCD